MRILKHRDLLTAFALGCFLIGVMALSAKRIEVASAEPEDFMRGAITDTIIATESCWLDSLNKTTNNGSDGDIYLYRSPGVHRRSLLRFDVNANMVKSGKPLPSNAAILAVHLRCVASKTGTSPDTLQTFGVYRCTRDWVESQATWNVYSTGNNWGVEGGQRKKSNANSGSMIDTTFAPTNCDVALIPSAVSCQDNQTVGVTITEIDITSMFRRWFNGTWKNQGMFFDYLEEGAAANTVRWYSDDATNSYFRPRVVITYVAPGGGGPSWNARGRGALGSLDPPLKRERDDFPDVEVARAVR